MTVSFSLHKQPLVMLINDDKQELDSMVVGLKKESIDAIGTASSSDALDVLHDSPVDVVLIDLMLADTNGLKLARKIHTKFPRVITMLMSDYLLSPVQLAKANVGVVGFVPKPCQFAEMADFVRGKIASHKDREEALVSSSSSYRDPDVNSPFDVHSLEVETSY